MFTLTSILWAAVNVVLLASTGILVGASVSKGKPEEHITEDLNVEKR
jgi:hypothetical protein